MHYTGWRHFLQAAIAARQRGAGEYGTPCGLLQPGLAVTAPAIFFLIIAQHSSSNSRKDGTLIANNNLMKCRQEVADLADILILLRIFLLSSWGSVQEDSWAREE